jgi:type I restriction enzyme S subunit
MKICKLSEIAKFKTGKLNSNAAEMNGRYPFFTCAPEPLKIDTYAFDTKAIILAGNNAEGNFHIQYFEGKFNAYQRTYIIETIDNSIVDIRYLYYALKMCLQHFKLISQGTATKFLTAKILSAFELPIPTIEEQQKIAFLLSGLDEKVKTNERINNNLEQQTQAIFKSWFVDFELNYGIMPSDWKVSQLGSIAKISTKVFSPAKNPNVEVEHYSIPAYDEKRYPVFETSNGIKSNKYRLSSNSVMISKLNPDTKRIWRPYCISDNPICSTEFIVYEPINPLNRDFIYSIIDSIGFSAFLCSHTTGSTNSRQRATPSITLTYDIIVPDEKTIQAFCSIVSPMYDTIENNIKENQKLAETRDKLLPKLMSGELDVSDIEI